MVTKIEKLIALAKDYALFGYTLNFKCNHTKVRGHLADLDGEGFLTEGFEINVYFTQGHKSWSVTFDKVEISDYCRKVTLPFDVSIDYLENLYVDASAYLNEHLIPNASKHEIRTKEQIEKDVEALNMEIKRLKSFL